MSENKKLKSIIDQADKIIYSVDDVQIHHPELKKKLHELLTKNGFKEGNLFYETIIATLNESAGEGINVSNAEYLYKLLIPDLLKENFEIAIHVLNVFDQHKEIMFPDIDLNRLTPRNFHQHSNFCDLELPKGQQTLIRDKEGL